MTEQKQEQLQITAAELDSVKNPLQKGPSLEFTGEELDRVIRGSSPAPHGGRTYPSRGIFAAADREAKTKVQQREKRFIFGNYGDRISYSSMVRKNAVSSLQLIRPEAVRWQIKERYGGGQQLRVQFLWRGISYDLVVTDPFWCIYLSRHPYGFYTVRAKGAMAQSRLYFTVSLGEPLQGYCYKLVAGVLWVPPPPGGRLYYEDKFVVEPVPVILNNKNALETILK